MFAGIGIHRKVLKVRPSFCFKGKTIFSVFRFKTEHEFSDFRFEKKNYFFPFSVLNLKIVKWFLKTIFQSFSVLNISKRSFRFENKTIPQNGPKRKTIF